MTLKEAKANIGGTVIYTPKHTPKEQHYGTIKSVNDKYVFVDYGDNTSKATLPEQLKIHKGAIII